MPPTRSRAKLSRLNELTGYPRTSWTQWRCALAVAEAPENAQKCFNALTKEWSSWTKYDAAIVIPPAMANKYR
eukprot:231797-Pyramimonas_sp.AAC.1